MIRMGLSEYPLKRIYNFKGLSVGQFARSCRINCWKKWDLPTNVRQEQGS
jgi:hypothetical protein